MEDIVIADRDEEFVEWVQADVRRRQQTEDEFYAHIDRDTGEVRD